MNASAQARAALAAEPAETPDVAIVGAGPAGLGAAAALAGAGLSVVVLERGGEAGGIPRHCGHSPFGMREFRRMLSGRAYGARLADAALKAGADVRLKHSVVAVESGPRLTVATPEGTRLFTPKRVILATGIREATRAARLVGGVRPLGVMNTGALQDMVYLRGLRPFRRPVVVGTELVSMSAILTCRHAGARPVAVIEKGDRAVVRAPFSWLPRTLGIPVLFRASIEAIAGTAGVEGVTVRHADGREESIACDGVIFTGGFTSEASLARGAGIAIDVSGSGGPVVDWRGRTSMAGVFAAGNTLRGVETAGWCWAEGRAVAKSVLQSLDGETDGEDGVRVEAGEGVKLVVPQRIGAGAAGGAFGTLQVRLSRPADGELRLAADGRVVWRGRIRSGPERRIGIPLRGLALPSGTEAVSVSVHDHA